MPLAQGFDQAHEFTVDAQQRLRLRDLRYWCEPLRFGAELALADGHRPRAIEILGQKVTHFRQQRDAARAQYAELHVLPGDCPRLGTRALRSERCSSASLGEGAVVAVVIAIEHRRSQSRRPDLVQIRSATGRTRNVRSGVGGVARFLGINAHSVPDKPQRGSALHARPFNPLLPVRSDAPIVPACSRKACPSLSLP